MYAPGHCEELELEELGFEVSGELWVTVDEKGELLCVSVVRSLSETIELGAYVTGPIFSTVTIDQIIIQSVRRYALPVITSEKLISHIFCSLNSAKLTSFSTSIMLLD